MATPASSPGPATPPGGTPDSSRRAAPRVSLRMRLTVLTTAGVAVVLVAGALVMSAALTGSRLSALDAEAAGDAETIADLARTDRIPDVLPVGEAGRIAQILDASGRVVATGAGASRTLPLVTSDQLGDLRAQADASGQIPARTVENGPYSDAVRLAGQEATWRGSEVTALVAVPAGDVLAVAHALRLALALAVPVLVAGWALVCWNLVGRSLRPVDDLRRGAEAVIASGGGGDLPVPAGRDEVAALARTLNSMLGKVREAADRQGRFVADAAHELRSPLASLRATVEVAALHPQVTDTVELAGEVDEELVRLSGLVDDLLLLARVGSTPRRVVTVDLAALARDVAEAGARGAGRPEVHVEVVGTGRARADRAAGERIVRNLVDNALHHARSEVRVDVRAGNLQVQDDGPGIPAAERERVFDRFVRLDAGRERHSGGSGLGLAIARELARSLGGDVVALDPPADGPGGARLVLTLPVG